MDYQIIDKYYKKNKWHYLIQCKKCGHQKEITIYNYEHTKLLCNGINCKDDYYNSFIGKQYGDYVVDFFDKTNMEYTLHCLKCGTKEKIHLRALTSATEQNHKHGNRCFKNLPRSEIKDIVSIRFNDIKQRCNNPNNNNYRHYGDRGIVCEYEFAVDLYYDFYKEILEHSLNYGLRNSTFDRIDVNQNYCKENLRIASQSIQSTNTTRKKVFILTDGNEKVICDNAMEFGRAYNLNGRSVGNVVRGNSKHVGNWSLVRVLKAEDNIEEVIKNEGVTTKLITT